jgi:Rhs element Vgr protein
MAKSTILNASRPADLVTTSIYVDGVEVSAEHQVLNIVVEKEINRIPEARIVVLDGDPAERDFPVSNEDIFLPGKEIEIKAGYHSDEETIFKGIVVKHSVKIRSDHSYLNLVCKDKSVKLTIGRKSKYFYEKTDSEIIGEIVDSYDLEKELDNTAVHYKEMVQYNATDWDFCVIRAQANGKVCVVDDGKISVKQPDTAQEEVETLTFGSTILDFDAVMDARSQMENIKTYAWDAGDQELKEAEANSPSVELNGNVDFKELSKALSKLSLDIKNDGGLEIEELQQWADAKFLFGRMGKIRGRVRFQGLSSVKPGVVVKLDGVGDRFNGKVFISGVRHQVVNGLWTTDAQFGLDPKWFAEKVDVNEVPAAGLVAAVNGLHIGIVTQLESDPDSEDRIKVSMPVIDDMEQGVWARIATLDAGENRGSFFRPEIGDEVIVGFINADPRQAVVLGMLNSSAKPAPLQAADENNEKGFVTRSELKLMFNDDKKSVVMETPAGKKITIDEDAGVIKLEDENSNVVTLSDSGIEIKSGSDISLKATGDVNIEGMNVNLKANAQFKAEGTAGAEVSATATTVIKGAMVQIN